MSFVLRLADRTCLEHLKIIDLQGNREMEVSGTFSMIQRPALPLTLMQSTENRSRFLWDYSVPPLTQKSSRFEWAIIRTQFDDSLLVKMKDKGMSSPGAR